jgi:hypothetical protein
MQHQETEPAYRFCTCFTYSIILGAASVDASETIASRGKAIWKSAAWVGYWSLFGRLYPRPKHKTYGWVISTGKPTSLHRAQVRLDLCVFNSDVIHLGYSRVYVLTKLICFLISRCTSWTSSCVNIILTRGLIKKGDFRGTMSKIIF